MRIMMIKLGLLLLMPLCFGNALIAQTSSNCWKEAEFEDILREYTILENKVYILPEQLHITNDGIFIFVQGEQVFVKQITCDEKGIYCFMEDLDKITDRCFNGHKMWCLTCGGCVVRMCFFRCKCVVWD